MKLSTRPHRAITTPRAIAVFAAASCAAAVLSAAGTAAASSSARLGAAHPPAVASAAAAWGGDPVAFSQWDLLPGGDLAGPANLFTVQPRRAPPCPAPP